MTTKEKIALINKAIDHIFGLSYKGELSSDELLYLYNEFWQLRQYLTELHLTELQGKDEKVFKED